MGPRLERGWVQMAVCRTVLRRKCLLVEAVFYPSGFWMVRHLGESSVPVPRALGQVHHQEAVRHIWEESCLRCSRAQARKRLVESV